MMTEVHSSCRLFTRSTGIENQWQINGKSMATIRSPSDSVSNKSVLDIVSVDGTCKAIDQVTVLCLTHLSIAATLWVPNRSGHLSITTTSLLQQPLYYSHLSITATSLLQPPLYYSHFVGPKESSNHQTTSLTATL